MEEILRAAWAGSPDGSDLPTRLAVACARALPVSGVGMALMTDEGPAGLIAATDGAALELEELQFTLGEGPCVDASRAGRPVLQPDLARTAPLRWPAFAGGALDAGIRAVFAFPLRVGAIRVGVLDLYRDRAGSLSADELAEALSFADAATLVLLHAQAGSPVLGAVAVLDERAEVHQATGVVSVQAAVGLAEALVLLRARAFAEGRPLGDLARDVLDGTVDFGSVDDSG
ncbi:plasmid stability protein [Geodermatophilus bullaregiensis]|uniref:GAF and ANTAR domain-containing protein n=1 Tax=Geodermatophilus bullaregiensis TaxID=1564160 RepID=UPI0019582BF0|nr:GAF and ANTAR domain-containing protein [Geodermatophilus bullaregiensis]MBM7804978.1 plasmid stability protein [Geodermatophilus bullaregiensis]